MNIRELANHPGMFMREDAAIQFDLFEANHGVIGVNRAMVSEADQQKLIDRWNQGGVYNRPPYLYEPKRPAKASDHVQGDAFDTSDITHTLAHITPYGFYRNYEWDKPHFKFDPARVSVRPTESDDMGTIDDNEHNQIVIGKAIQRALKYDARPNGYGANWQLGPTIWERLNQIEAAAKLGATVEFDAEDAKLIADAIPKELAKRVVDELKSRL